MNVQEGIAQRQLIAKNLIVGEALEEVCSDLTDGDLSQRKRQKLVQNIKVCTQALARFTHAPAASFE